MYGLDRHILQAEAVPGRPSVPRPKRGPNAFTVHTWHQRRRRPTHTAS